MPPQDYFLSDEENRRIFDEQIRPAEFADLERRGGAVGEDGGRPICVLVAGQTGAGKTRTAPQLSAAFGRLGRRFVHLIADTYKTYHPDYARLVREKPGLASPAAGYDARRWLALSCDYAIRLRLDALVESACRNPADFTSLADAFRRAGFRVLVVVLAVHAAQSRLGILIRYFSDLPEARSRSLPLRLTPRNVHDESYDGLVSVAQFIDASDAVDRVVVVRRGNLVGYANARSADGEWRSPPETAGALDRERCRSRVHAEVDAFDHDLRKLREEHPEKEAELAEIQGMFSTVQDAASDEPSSPELHELDCLAFMGEEDWDGPAVLSRNKT